MLSFNNCLDVARHLPYMFHSVTFFVCPSALWLRYNTSVITVAINSLFSTADALVQQLPGRGSSPALSLPLGDVPGVFGRSVHARRHARAGGQYYTLAVYLLYAELLRYSQVHESFHFFIIPLDTIWKWRTNIFSHHLTYVTTANFIFSLYLLW